MDRWYLEVYNNVGLAWSFGETPTLWCCHVDVFEELYNFYRGFIDTFRKLFKLYIEYDIEHCGFTGTHMNMDRRIARLKKLLRLLEEYHVSLPSWCGPCYSISFRELLYPLTEPLWELSIILSRFNDIHRIRDKIHEFIYPILRWRLDSLMNFRIGLRDSRYKIIITCFHGKLDIELHTDNRFIPLKEHELEKIFERRKKSMQDITSASRYAINIFSTFFERGGYNA
jgi:hypothetical protein